jgi:hypothetical protein
MKAIFTRDSGLWTVLMTFGLAIATALIVANNPADYGLSSVQFKWVQLFAVGLVAVGKLGTSPLPHSEEGHKKITKSGE